MTYAEKLRDPRWQKKRLEILDRNGWVCRDCKDGESQLHVHHTKYEKGDPWDIESAYLIAVCDSCHERRGIAERAIRNHLADHFVLYNVEQIEDVARHGFLFRPQK